MKYRLKDNRRILSILLIIFILLPSVTIGSGFTWENFLEVKNIIEENYYMEVSEEKLLEGATKGLFFYLDEYSEYYTEEEYKKLEESLSGTQTGVGLYITENEKGEVEVLAPLEGGSAHQAGVKAGDIIKTIDGIDIGDKPMEEVVDLLIGVDGTFLTLTVKRGQRTLPFYIQREEMQIKPVEHGYIEDKIGYLRIVQFIDGTSKDVEKALKNFERKGINDIILDLRGNPGGYLTETLEVADLLIPKGPVVYVKSRHGEEVYNSNANFTKNKYKMVVLVDGDSASASEIIAGAVQDRKVGTIVGTKTFGKAKVQELAKLEKGGLKISTAEYLTPNRINIGGKGIVPDIKVEVKGEEDSQLNKAIELLK